MAAQTAGLLSPRMGGVQEGWGQPLVRTPIQEGTQLSTPAHTVNDIFHKSLTHTFHLWVAGFPLRTKTISL